MLDFVGEFLPVIAAAGLIAFAATPFTLLLARRAGFFDQPSTRKFHLAPAPLLGGLAIYAGLLAGLLVFGFDEPLRELAAIAAGATVIGGLGLWDDRYGMHPRLKLLGQVLAAGLLVVGGIQTHFLNSWLDVPLTILWVVGICNAINFQDNMDGLAAGTAAVVSAVFLTLAILNGQTLVAGLAAAVLGACLGFLFYNFSPAILFMGDAGSLVLGFTLAVLGIKLQFTGRPPLSTWMIPAVVLGAPIFDTLLVTVSRLRRRVAVDQGGTDHLSHRLVRLGMSPRRAVVALYAVSAALGIAAIWMSQSTVPLANGLLGLLAALALVALWLLEDARTLPLPARRPGVKPDMRVTVIASGDALPEAIAAAAQLSRDVRVALTPVEEGAPAGWRQVSPQAFRAAVVALARQPSAAGEFLLNGAAPAPAGPFDLAGQAEAATAAFQLHGSLPASAGAVLEAVGSADLLLIWAGDPGDNLLPTVATPEVAERLRRSKRPRVLVAQQPAAALGRLQEAAGAGMVTHVIARERDPALPQSMPVYQVAELEDAAAVGDALALLWLERRRAWASSRGKRGR